MPLSCVNDGGLDSLIRLPRAPLKEQLQPLSVAAGEALRRWRARPGEIFSAQAPDGTWWRSRLSRGPDGVDALVTFACQLQPAESPLQLTVAQALPARERFELVLEKLTELGANRIVPLVTERSLTSAERDQVQRKSHRWPEVLLRAARQCRRGMVPELTAETSLPSLLAAVPPPALLLLLDERGSGPTLGTVLAQRPAPQVWLLVGPEGGFTETEVALAQAAGAVAATLGGRILRTETAAIAAAALIQHRLGDLG